jgi:hypothetical protein
VLGVSPHSILLGLRASRLSAKRWGRGLPVLHEEKLQMWSPLIQLMCLMPVSPQAQVVEVTAKPDRVYIERSEAGQHLNFEFLLENRSAERLLLSAVTLSVLDDNGMLARREFVNEYSRASLELAGLPALEPGAVVLVFNPFHFFSRAIPIKKLSYEFTFRTPDRTRRHKAHLSIVPVFYDTKTDLMIPLRGRVLVWDGHDYQSHHRRFDYTRPPSPQLGNKTNFTRYGYDFVVVNGNGLMYGRDPKEGDDWYPGKSDRNEDYYGFGVPILATGNGRVVAFHDGEADNRRFNQAEQASREMARAGNYVIIDHLNGEYSLFAHLRHGSVRVKVGQDVKRGAIIAQMGASGDALFPHLHYELRNGIGAREVEGLPSYFTNFRRLLGSRPLVVKRGQVDTGDIVESIGSAR